MLIIGITGPSGGGKSTFAKMLSEWLYNAILIHVDDFMYESVRYYQTDFSRIFGLPIFERNDVKTFRQAVIQSGLREWREYLNLILPYMNTRIDKALMDVEVPGVCVVIEWFHLPFSRVWKHSNYRAIIDASDQDIRRARLLMRMLNREEYKQYSVEELRKSIEMKDELSGMSFNNLKDCMEIKNNYDELTLQHEAVRIAGVINKYSPESGDLTKKVRKKYV